MYIQFKAGFVEADRWDGSEIPNAAMQSVVDKLVQLSMVGSVKVTQSIIVCRSREASTLRAIRVLAGVPSRPVFESPAGWDYEYRTFLTAEEWGRALAAIASDLDYRNFKSWTSEHAPAEHHLAHAIWHAANTAKSMRLTEEANAERRRIPFEDLPSKRGAKTRQKISKVGKIAKKEV